MSAINNILLSFKHGSITQAQAAAEIEELIELERVQLRDTFAGQALQGIVAHDPTFSKIYIQQAADDSFSYADAMLVARKQRAEPVNERAA